MAQLIHIEVVCDSCASRDVHREGKSITVALGSDEPKNLDLCDECATALMGSLRELLHERGQPAVEKSVPTRRRRRGGQMQDLPRTEQCPECEYKAPNRGSLRSHLSQIHDISLAELETKDPNIPTPCQCKFCHLAFRNNQGLQSHTMSKHPEEWIRLYGVQPSE